MTAKEKRNFTVISGSQESIIKKTNNYNNSPSLHTNPMYEKLLNFRNLQEAQKKKFSVDDLFKLC